MKKRLSIGVVLAATLVLLSALAAPGSANVTCEPVGSYPGHTLVGTYFVPGNGYPAFVTVSGLVPGQYLLEASGTYCPGSPWESDAEYVCKPPDFGWQDWVPGYCCDECLDELEVDSSCVEWSGGDFQSDHVYTLPWTVTGDSLTLRIYDWYPYNNSGGLCVALFRAPIEVQIDIKPGSDPNCFNNDGHGVIPVAILGTETFFVTTIDPGTVQLEGLAVRMVGKSDKLLAHIEDTNSDGFDDLVVQIEDTDGIWSVGTSLATVTGALYDGTPIAGQDYVCITQ